jgi:SAM-dependent methyltransferase
MAMETANEDQVAYWNEQSGPTWAAMQKLIDAQIAPLGLQAIDALTPRAGECVLDIGCGCGDTTLEIARRVRPRGEVLGLDISAPMLEVAVERAAAIAAADVGFRRADAQIARFDARFDAAFSRFGVMFFADPIAAFTNIHDALRPGGRIAFVCWRDPAENPWMMVPLAAALRFVPPPPPMDPTEPGPFAFADASRVRAILMAAGFEDIVTAPFDIEIGGFGLNQALELALRIGPLGKLLREVPDRHDSVVGAVREALAAHDTGHGVWLKSGTWIVSASRA